MVLILVIISQFNMLITIPSMRDDVDVSVYGEKTGTEEIDVVDVVVDARRRGPGPLLPTGYVMSQGLDRRICRTASKGVKPVI